MKPVFHDAEEALRDILTDGMTLMVGGFGICGIAEALINAVEALGAKRLTCISNNCGIDEIGLGRLLHTRQISKMIASYVGGNREFERQYLSGELELEFCPQGSLAERCRAGGAGIPAFFTRTGVGTLVAKGKEVRRFDGVDYLMETALHADIALIKAWKADAAGNLVFHRTARNFNQPMATAGRISVVEVEEVVPVGTFDPDEVHLPGIYVQRLLLNPHPEKHIEFRTTRQRDAAPAGTGSEI